MSCWVVKGVQTRCYLNKPETLSPDMQAARFMTTVSVLSGVFGVVSSVAARRCTKFFTEDRSKLKAVVVSGVFFTVSALLCCVSVSWHAAAIMTDIYDPTSSFIKKSQMGAALYIGWGATALLLVGGALLVWSCTLKQGFTGLTCASTSRGSVNGLPASGGTLGGEEQEENYELICRTHSFQSPDPHVGHKTPDCGS